MIGTHCPNFLRVSAVMMSAVAALIASAHEGPHAGELDDPDHLEIFMDGVVNTVMYQRQIPGAVLVIVKDGSVIVSKGYGYADADKKAPVLPDRTLFRIASVSKTINATAVMQLVEQGKLDLNGDANALLEKYHATFTIPQHYSRKIRLLDLIDHTAGLDERAIGMSRLNKDDVPALGTYLAARMPPQVMEPRTTISYSNHGVAASGYLVELASGQPYALYVRDHIFTPLGMTHSGFEWSDAIAADMAQGYQVQNGRVKPVPFDFICIPPAGGMLSTGQDMAQFAIMHLQNGLLGDTHVLQPATAAEMHREQYEQDSRLGAGIAVGFFTGTRNGRRYLEHGGDLNGFASELWLLPDEGVGLFTSCNVDDGALRGAIVGQFMDRYFPGPAQEETKPEPGLADAANTYAGAYRSNRFARRSIEKLTTLVEQLRVTADNDGNLNIRGPAGGIQRFVATSDGEFLSTRDGDRAVFRVDNNRRVTHLLFPSGAWERLRWYEETIWQSTFIGVVLAILATAVIAWPVAFAVRAIRGKKVAVAPAYYRVTAWFCAALALYLVVTLAVTLIDLDKWEFTYGMPGRMAYLLMLPPLVVLGAVLLAVNTAAIWLRGYWSGWARLHYTIVTLATVMLIPFFRYWNLIGFNW